MKPRIGGLYKHKSFNWTIFLLEYKRAGDKNYWECLVSGEDYGIIYDDQFEGYEEVK